jgi:hypothetical protein
MFISTTISMGQLISPAVLAGNKIWTSAGHRFENKKYSKSVIRNWGVLVEVCCCGAGNTAIVFRQCDNWVGVQIRFGIQVYDWVNSKKQYTSINFQPE